MEAAAPPVDASPPLGSLGRELADIQERPMTISLGLGIVVGLAGPLLVYAVVSGGLLRQENAIAWIWLAAAVCIGSFVAAAAVAAFLPSFLLSPRDRAASATHAWVGAREVRRLLGSPGKAIGLPTTRDEAAHWLATTPDTTQLLPLRLEMLLLTRRFDEARAAADRFPRRTPIDEFRAAEALAMVEQQVSGNADLSAARDAIRRIPDKIDRAEATASLAVLEARRLIGRGDWRAPLVAARAGIPGSDFAILARDLSAPIFRFLLPRVVAPVAAFIVLVALAVTFMALA